MLFILSLFGYNTYCMKKTIKKVGKRALSHGVHYVKKSPRAKRIAKKIIHQYAGGVPPVEPYQRFVEQNMPDAIDVVALRRECGELKYTPLLSVIVPTYNTNEGFLRECLDSVLAQVYENWELCIVDDASTDKRVRKIVKEYASRDARIKYRFNKKNQHIAGASNDAVSLASGEFLCLFDHDDMLWPHALLEVAKALNIDKSLDFIYTDEDKISENRHHHFAPFFKPDWNPDFMYSVNYITHFSTIRTSVFHEVGGFLEKYNGAQDWDLFLRVTHHTPRIHHIPKVVYSWRVHDQSTAKSTDAKPYVVEAQRSAIEDDLVRKGYNLDDVSVSQNAKHPGYWVVEHALKGDPLISIVIPSKDQYNVMKRCIDSIYAKTTYNNFEVILVDTGSTDKRVWRYYDAIKEAHNNFKVVEWNEVPFSYVRSCNEGARQASGEFLMMLNNDTEVITPDWLERLAGDAQRPGVAAVGPLLFYPDGEHIQHAGVGVGLGGVAANSFSMMTLTQPLTQTQHLMLNTKHNMSAVTAACMMVRAEVFREVGGFKEEYRITYNDVDLCLRFLEAGYVNIFTPHVQLLHHESISLGTPEEQTKRDTKEMRDAMSLFKKDWAKYVSHDPHLNPNFNKENSFYDI